MVAGVGFHQEHKFRDGTELLKEQRENIVRVRNIINLYLKIYDF